MLKIAVDMFGGDNGPEIVVRGAVRALYQRDGFEVVLAGSSLIADIVAAEEAAALGADASRIRERISVIDTNSFVTNNDDPRCMVRDKNDSSMVLALEALRDDSDIKAMVTAGSTGCALVGSCFHLGLEKGLLQPALMSLLPRKGDGLVAVLDCGSNLEPKPKDLADYARLGAAFYRSAYGVQRPVAGLVNVGKESSKGTAALRQAYDLMEKGADEHGYLFAGNIEGGDILSGDVDIAVCDGFTGNVMIKGFEAAGLLAADLAKEEGSKAAERIKGFFDYNSQAGAVFAGTRKPVIKAHGAATEKTICSCILQALDL